MALRHTVAAALFLPIFGASAAAMDQSAPGALKLQSTEVLVARVGTLSAEEIEAIAFRHLQTELMVAALSCGQPLYRSQYNSFVTRFRVHLRRNANTLTAMFARTYGRQGKRRLDDYVTKLANEFSIRSMVRSDYCLLAGRKLDVVLSVDHGTTAAALIQRADNF